jgi:hypothetical protein
MNFRTRTAIPFLAALFACTATTLHAGDASVTSAASSDALTPSTPDTRYGLFGLLDHRSSYGQGVYPEPFLVDDSDLEQNEFRLDWYHAKAGSSRTDIQTTELEHGIGQLTLEIEVPYERDTTPDGIAQGMDNIDLGARYPLYQYVSRGGFFDTTFGVAAEVGIPMHSSVSKNTEVVPKIFNDLRIGSHISLQSIVGYSMLYGPGDDGGLHTFEYGFVLGYTIPHKELPLPGVDQLIPVFELSGEKQVNHDAQDSLIANLAFRVNLKAIGRIQPRLGVGYFFPLNEGTRADVHHGIYTSLVFEF